MKKSLLTGILFAVAFAELPMQVAAFTAGDLVVVRAGDGTTALSSSAALVNLVEFNTTGLAQSPINTIALPTTASGANGALTLSGSATSEGFLALSTDGQYLTLAGYNAAPGTASITTATPTAVNRVVGRVDLNGNVDTSTVLTDSYNGSNIRSAASTDGNSIWTGGNAGSGQGATAAVRYTTLGSTSATQLNSTASNMRVVKIFNGQLYVTSSTGTNLGINTIGTGLPTSSFTGAPTALPGTPTSGTHSFYDFFFSDLNTLYVADDGTAANGGGIQKWTFDGTLWNLQYTLLNTGAATTGIRGLTGFVEGNGSVDLFGTTATSSANSLIKVVDTGVNTSTFTTLATAPANDVFRGVALLSVPEPNGILALGALVMVFGRKLFRRN